MLLGKQIGPLRMAGFFACCALGDDVDESLQMRPVMDIEEIAASALCGCKQTKIIATKVKSDNLAR